MSRPSHTGIDIDALIDERSDPAARSVLEDLTRSSGDRVTRLGTAIRIIYRPDDGADDDADGADDAADDADDADDADAAADDADAAADAAAEITTRMANLTDLLFDGDDMKDGLKIIQVPGRYAGYYATLVGWVQRIGGDEWIMLPGYRVVVRTGAGRGLAGLAADGPGRDYRLKDPSEGPCELHRLLIGSPRPARRKAWAQHIATLATCRKQLAAWDAEEAAA